MNFKNAVLKQIWIAIIYYLILCYLKFKTRMDSNLLEITRMIQEVIFERISLLHIINIPLVKITKIKKKHSTPPIIIALNIYRTAVIECYKSQIIKSGFYKNLLSKFILY